MIQQELFQLIKSLTQAEKSYFKKYVTTHSLSGEQLYVQLFDAIERQENYDEGILIQQFAEGKSPSWLATVKRYLYDAILRSLRAYDEQKSLRYKAENRKNEAELLIQRGLYDQGLKRLKKASQLAYQLEYFSLLIELLRLENNTIGLHLLDKQAIRKQEINAEITRLLQLLDRERFYFNLYDRLFTYSRMEHSLRTAESWQELHQLMQHPYMQEGVPLESLLAKQLFYGAHYTWQTLLGNYDLAYRYSRSCLVSWVDYPLLQRERFKDYLAIFSNHINRCYQMKRPKEVLELLTTLRQIKAPNASLQVLAEVRVALHHLSYYELTRKYNDYEKTVQEIEQLFERRGDTIAVAEKRLLLYNIANQFLVQGKYERALHFCVALLQLPKSEVQNYLQRFARLLELLLHYESGNQQLLDYTWRNCYNFFKSQDKLYQFEQLFLQLIRRLTDEMNQYGQQDTFQEFYLRFAQLQTDAYESRAFEYLDVLTWLRAKQERTTMAAIYSWNANS